MSRHLRFCSFVLLGSSFGLVACGDTNATTEQRDVTGGTTGSGGADAGGSGTNGGAAGSGVGGKGGAGQSGKGGTGQSGQGGAGQGGKGGKGGAGQSGKGGKSGGGHAGDLAGEGGSSDGGSEAGGSAGDGGSEAGGSSSNGGSSSGGSSDGGASSGGGAGAPAAVTAWTYTLRGAGNATVQTDGDDTWLAVSASLLFPTVLGEGRPDAIAEASTMRISLVRLAADGALLTHRVVAKNPKASAGWAYAQAIYVDPSTRAPMLGVGWNEPVTLLPDSAWSTSLESAANEGFGFGLLRFDETAAPIVAPWVARTGNTSASVAGQSLVPFGSGFAMQVGGPLHTLTLPDTPAMDAGEIAFVGQNGAPFAIPQTCVGPALPTADGGAYALVERSTDPTCTFLGQTVRSPSLVRIAPSGAVSFWRGLPKDAYRFVIRPDGGVVVNGFTVEKKLTVTDPSGAVLGELQNNAFNDAWLMSISAEGAYEWGTLLGTAINQIGQLALDGDRVKMMVKLGSGFFLGKPSPVSGWHLLTASSTGAESAMSFPLSSSTSQLQLTAHSLLVSSTVTVPFAEPSKQVITRYTF